MANHLRTSRDSARSGNRHGKDGYVNLHVDVRPEVKDKLVVIAREDGIAYAAVVRDALDFYLDAVGS